MLRLIIILWLVLVVQVNTFAQTTKKTQTFYTGVINVAEDAFRFPLIGFVNIGLGDFSNAMIGFVNWNQKNLRGVQIGYLNVNKDSLSGLQLGFANFGKSINGTQIGFLNYCDSLNGGIPIGLMSLVRKGGYQSVEIASDGISPIAISIKTGIDELYTSLNMAINPGRKPTMSIGAGIGAFHKVNGKIFFNPEVTFLNSNASSNFNIAAHFLAVLRLKNWEIVAGPSANFLFSTSQEEQNFPQPVYLIDIGNRNNLAISFKIGLRYRLGKF